MAQPGYTAVQIYRSTTPGAIPSASNLGQGELALNLTDKILYTKDASNNVVALTSGTAGLPNAFASAVVGATTITTSGATALTFIAGTNVTLSGDNTGKSITINSTASGGGGGGGNNVAGGSGGGGVVRILWDGDGTHRYFPTNAADV